MDISTQILYIIHRHQHGCTTTDISYTETHPQQQQQAVYTPFSVRTHIQRNIWCPPSPSVPQSQGVGACTHRCGRARRHPLLCHAWLHLSVGGHISLGGTVKLWGRYVWPRIYQISGNVQQIDTETTSVEKGKGVIVLLL